MHTMRRIPLQHATGHVWHVGVWHPDSRDGGVTVYEWESIEEFASKTEAAAYCSWLNGGERPANVGRA